MATGTTKTEIRLTREEVNQALMERFWPSTSKVAPTVRLLCHGADCHVTDAILSGEERLFDEKVKRSP